MMTGAVSAVCVDAVNGGRPAGLAAVQAGGSARTAGAVMLAVADAKSAVSVDAAITTPRHGLAAALVDGSSVAGAAGMAAAQTAAGPAVSADAVTGGPLPAGLAGVPEAAWFPTAVAADNG